MSPRGGLAISRTLAIGDIHGCLKALLALEEFVGFSPDDTLIFLGDYVDRGPNTKGVIEWLIERKSRMHNPERNFITLRGNHEVMMLEARTKPNSMTWRFLGGEAVLQSYAGDGDELTLSNIPQEHWEFLENDLQPHHETDRYLFAHGSMLPDRPCAEQPDEILYWQTFGEWFEPHFSGKTLICGHTSQKDGLPKTVPGCVCIDTWVYGNGWLTCLDCDTGEYWQTKQKRQTKRRTGQLTMPTV